MKKEKNEQSIIASVPSQYRTGKSVLSNASLSWNGLGVSSGLYPPPPDRIASPSRPEHHIILHVAHPDHLERRLDRGRWLRSPSYPGGLTFVPAHRSPEWLWDAEVELLNIYLQPELLESIALESCDIAAQKVELTDRFAMRDPLLVVCQEIIEG